MNTIPTMKRTAHVLALLAFVACGFNQTIAQPPVPVSWWRGENNVVDSVGANGGSVYVPPAVTYVDGRYGQAFSFSGGIMNIPDATDLKPAVLTLQTWVKAPVSSGGYRYIVSKGRPGGASYALYTGGDGGLHFYVFQDGAVYIVTPGPDPAAVWNDDWHQVTGTWDGTTCRLYLDGVEVGSAEGPGSIDYSEPGPLLFADYQAAGGLPYVGMMDEVKLFNRPLTTEEVAETFADPAAAAGTDGLVGWWKGEGTPNDSWGTHHGSVPPPKVFAFGPGRSGSAFFPKGGIARVPDSESLRPTQLTASAWVKSVTPGMFGYLLSKSQTAGGVSYAFYTGNAGGVRFFVNLGANGLPISPIIYPEAVWDGAWHLITGTYDGATVRVYLDGLEVGTGTEGYGDIDYTSPTELVFGAYTTSGDYPFVGLLDDVQLYDRALTDEEVLASYKENRLASWWQANLDARDSVSDNHGVMSGGASFGLGRLTGAAFDTRGGSVQIPDSPSLQPANLTLQAMVAARSPGANKYLVSKSLNPTDASYALFTGTDGGLAFYVTTSGGRVVSPAAAASIWDGLYHVVDGTYDGQSVRLYVDGKEVGTGTPATGSPVYGTSQSAGKLVFGDFAETPSGANFAGQIDEVKLYTTALTAAEILPAAIESVLIVDQPAGRTFNPGADLTLSVRAQGPGPLSYQWQRYGTNLPGATNAVLVLANAQSAQEGPYGVVISAGTLQYTDGQAGRAFRHQSGGLVRVPNAPSFETDNFTIECWVRGVAPGNYKHIVAKARDVEYYSGSYGFYTADTGGVKWYVVLTGPSLGFVTAAVPPEQVWDGAWHHLTGTWDGQFVNVYLDGALMQSSDSFGGNVDYQTYFLNGDLIIGDVWGTQGPWHFPGDIDEVKYFDRALTAEDVLDSHDNPNGSAGTTGLISWWKAEDNTWDSLAAHDGFAVPPPGSVLSDPAVLTSTAPTAPLLTQSAIVEGSFQATLTGTANQTYVIERSANLRDWAPLTTNMGTFTFADPVAPGSAARFYRAQAQQ